MNNKILSLIALISFTTFGLSAAAAEPVTPAPADPIAAPSHEHDELSERLQKVEEKVAEHDDQLQDQGEQLLSHEEQLAAHDKRIKRNEAFRLYGTAAFGGLASSGGMFLGYMTALPVLLVTSDHKTTVNEVHAVGFATAGTVAAMSTFGVLKMLNASWTTAAVAAGATMGTAMVGAGAAMVFTKQERLGSLMAVYPLTIAAAGAVTAGTVILTNTLEKKDVE